MNRFIIGVALAIALVGPASAGTFYHYLPSSSQNPKTAAGIISADGEVERGAGFTVQHRFMGEYAIAFGPAFFPTGCASIVVESWAIVAHKAVLSEAYVSGCAENNPVFHVRLRRSDDGIPIDKDFQFVAVGV
jgi:hypothetical protein